MRKIMISAEHKIVLANYALENLAGKIGFSSKSEINDNFPEVDEPLMHDLIMDSLESCPEDTFETIVEELKGVASFSIVDQTNLAEEFNRWRHDFDSFTKQLTRRQVDKDDLIRRFDQLQSMRTKVVAMIKGCEIEYQRLKNLKV